MEKTYSGKKKLESIGMIDAAQSALYMEKYKYIESEFLTRGKIEVPNEKKKLY